MKTEQRPAKVVVLNRSGWRVHYPEPEKKGLGGYATGREPEPPLETEEFRIEDGTPVLDIRQAVETEQGKRWSIIGPLCDASLEPGEIRKGGYAGPELQEVLEGTLHGTVAMIHEALSNPPQSVGPLDSVSAQEYVKGWVRNGGARLGTYQNGKPVFQQEGAQQVLWPETEGAKK